MKVTMSFDYLKKLTILLELHHIKIFFSTLVYVKLHSFAIGSFIRQFWPSACHILLSDMPVVWSGKRVQCYKKDLVGVFLVSLKTGSYL